MRILAGDFQEVALLFLATLLQLQYVNCTITTDLYRSYYLYKMMPMICRFPQLPSTEAPHPAEVPQGSWNSSYASLSLASSTFDGSTLTVGEQYEYVACPDVHLMYSDSLEHGLLYSFQEIQCAVIIISATWRNLHEQLSPHFLKSLDSSVLGRLSVILSPCRCS